MRQPNAEPYGFSISYKESIESAYTLLTGRKRVPKKDAMGNLLPGEYDEVEIPNSYPLLTREGGARVREVLEQNMDKFNPIAKLKDSDCATRAAQVERSLAASITLNAPKYIYDFEFDASSRLVLWNAWLTNLTESLYTFATLARDGHFIAFAGKIMAANYDPGAPQQEEVGPLRRLMSMRKPHRNIADVNDM